MRKILFAVVCLLLCGTARAQNFVPIVSGVATVDASQGTNAQTSSFLIILNANVTSLEIIKPKTGQQITIILQQDSTGGRTVSCAADVLNCVTVTSTASAVTSQAFAYNSNTNKWSGLSGKSSAGSGTVTSVAETVPTWLTVAGSPITSAGTLAVTPTTAQTSHQVIGTCGAGTTFAPCALVAGDLPAGGYTLDQIGNPVAAKSFALGTNLPLAFTTAGVFTSAAENGTLEVALGGGACPFSTVIEGSTKVTDAISGCISTPSSGVTNGFSDALAGYVKVNDPNQGGQFGKVLGVGVYPVCQAAANNTRCIAAAPQAEDLVGETGTQIEGIEVGMGPANTTTTGWGILLSFEGTPVQPASDNLPAISVQTPTAAGTFTSGLECNDASVSSAYCIRIGQFLTGSSSASQAIDFKATNSVPTTFHGVFQFQGDDVLTFSAPFTVGNASGEESYGIFATSTASIAHGMLVKIDTAHADSFVICTTADTSCDGFVQGTNLATSGLCGAGSTVCPIVTVPGSKVQGILGTGTCSIGNYVIVDTTTNGRVKCTATPPTIGNEIGKALSAQSSVGSTVDVLTKFE